MTHTGRRGAKISVDEKAADRRNGGKMDIRLERPEDYRETENMTREAFWNHFAPACDEHYLLHVMRDSSAFLPGLNFVAEQDGRIIGNVVCTKAVVHGDDKNSYEVLCLGPIAVLPEFQRTGVGSRLIAHTKETAREMGFRAIFLCGDPDYYSRHGFVPAEAFGIRMADNMYAVAHQVCELYENALSGIKGRYVEDAVYKVDAAEAKEFDKGFPAKEMVTGTPSQKRFDELVVMRKSAD